MGALNVWFSVLYLCWTFTEVQLLENGLARTPPMGWMSWGYYMCGVNCEKNPDKCLKQTEVWSLYKYVGEAGPLCLHKSSATGAECMACRGSENLIKSVADTFYKEGYQEVGFEYIIIDDCWAEKSRDSDGRLVPDRKRFPNGMKHLADYIHARGLKFGMYTNIADVTCMKYPGSKGHFAIDAKTFASWEVDYLKVDGCFVGEDYLNTAYVKLGHYLNATGRPMVYSCSWPYYIEYIIRKKPNYAKIVPQCNMWRNYHDVVTTWEAVKAIIRHYEQAYDELSQYHGPGHWNDPDMLIFGTGALTESQSRVHLAVYVMLSAPLLLSCDMEKMKDYEKRLLLNLDLLSVGQDALGVMARPYVLENSITLWVKPHHPRKGDQYHTTSFALVNLEEYDAPVSFTPGLYGLNSSDGYTVMDIFTKKYLRNITLNDEISVMVPAEDVIMYSVFPL